MERNRVVLGGLFFIWRMLQHLENVVIILSSLRLGFQAFI